VPACPLVKVGWKVAEKVKRWKGKKIRGYEVCCAAEEEDVERYLYCIRAECY